MIQAQLVARVLAAAVAATAVLAAAAVPALAATGGLVYRTSKPTPLPAGKQASAKANCPDDKSVVGGGLEIEGGNTATGMQSSLPFDDEDGNAVPDDGWLTVANSRSAGDKALRAFAVCSRTGRFSYVKTASGLVPNNSKGQVEAACPAGQSVAGGGVSLTQGGAETFYTADTTRPIDLPSDPDSIPDDGWRAAASNKSGVDQSVTAYAVCAIVRSGSYRYRETTKNIASGAQDGARAGCPPRSSVTAGGVAGLVAGTDLTAEIASSLPFDTADPDRIRDDGWQGAINNNGPASAGMGVYAVCRTQT